MENIQRNAINDVEETYAQSFIEPKDDKGVDKKIWDVTFDLLNRYGHKWAEIHALNHIWFYMNYGFEYGTEFSKSENLPRMYKSAPMYFTMSRIAIERTSRIELTKLFEGDDTASIRYLRKHLEKHSSIICYSHSKVDQLKVLNTKLECYLSENLNSIEALKEIRNKHLAHNDLEVFLNIAKLYEEQRVVINDVFNIIDYIGEYLDNVAQLIQPQNASASVCPKYHELMDIQSLEMYFIKK